MKIAVLLVVSPRWISTALQPRGREDKKPCSCWKSRRRIVQLYFCAIPETVKISFSSCSRVGAILTIRKVKRNILSLRLCKSSSKVFASLLNVTRSGGRMFIS